jgi:hypothetical protein
MSRSISLGAAMRLGAAILFGTAAALGVGCGRGRDTAGSGAAAEADMRPAVAESDAADGRESKPHYTSAELHFVGDPQWRTLDVLFHIEDQREIEHLLSYFPHAGEDRRSDMFAPWETALWARFVRDDGHVLAVGSDYQFWRVNGSGDWEVEGDLKAYFARFSPVRTAAGSGTMKVTPLENAEPERFTVEYAKERLTWTLTATSGDRASDQVEAAPEGTAWTMTIGAKVTVVITQGRIAFETGDRLEFSLFRRTAMSVQEGR